MDIAMTSDTEFQQEIYEAQVEKAYERLPSSLMVNLVNSCVLTYVQWEAIAPSTLTAWFSSLTLISLLRLGCYLYKKKNVHASSRHWGILYIIGLLLSGMVWGSAGILLFPENDVAHQVIVAFVLGGMVAGATASSGALPNAFYFYCIPALTPILFNYSQLDGKVGNAMCLMILVFAVFSVATYRHIHKMIYDLIAAQINNEQELKARRHAERKAKEHQEFLEAVLYNIEDGIAACDERGNLTLFNRATQEFHGIPQQKLAPEEWARHYDLYMEDGKTLMQQEDIPLYRAFQEQQVQNQEMCIIPKDGEERILLASGQALFGGNGKKIGAVISMHDITKEKKAQIALQNAYDDLELKIHERTEELVEVNRELIIEVEEHRKTEEKLVQQNKYINSILESVSHPLYAIDVNDYTIKMANTASGIKAGDTSTCYALTHRQDSPCLDGDHPCPLEIIKKTHKPTMVEHTHYDAKGNRLNVEVYAYPVFDQDGELVQMIEYCIDVTDRKQALRDLADEKERLSVTLRSIGDGVITTDISGKVVMLNKVAEDLTGWSNDEATGRPLEEVFHIINELTREVCENPVAKVISSKQIVGLANHTVLIARDGTERSIADSGAPILDAESNIVGVVLVFRNVTEQIKTEKELLKVKKLESIGVLAGGIAHDFNNILAAILGNINLALFDKDLSDRTERLLSEAEKATLRAKNLTRQLLTFAKGGEPVKEISSLGSVIRDSADFVLHGDKTASRYEIPDDLWLVDIDTGQISQVIQNIVLNASHAMPEGGTIKITCENLASVGKDVLPFAKDGRFVKVSIQDSGIGMPANVVEKIFDPYFSTKQEGSGLGLAIAQSILVNHNGHILVESAPGVGSTFNIYLPVSERTTTQKEESLGAIKASSPAKILLMDDDEMVRSMAKEMLAHLGHEIVLAVEGEEAIKLYQESITSGSHFDLVIMDLTVPGGIGGKEAVQKILKIDRNAKVIVSSGYSTDPVMANFRDYGFCSAIIKPYQLQELSKVIGQVMD